MPRTLQYAGQCHCGAIGAELTFGPVSYYAETPEQRIARRKAKWTPTMTLVQ